MTYPDTLQTRRHPRWFPHPGIAGLLVLCIVSVGCGDDDPLPDPGGVVTLTLASVSPSSGVTSGTRAITLLGSGFRSGATVSFGGVTAFAVVAGDTRIVAEAPPHAAGPVDVIVTNADGQTVTLRAAFAYVVAQDPPLSITTVSPPAGSTGGSAPVAINGTGFRTGAKVTFDSVPALGGPTAVLFDGSLYVTTPPHGLGPVTVVVTNPDGQNASLSGGYTYVSPGSFDFNGEWDAGAGVDWHTPLPFTIRNNTVVEASCGGVPLPLPSPPPTVSGGEFSIISNGVTIMTGRIVTNDYATGRINTPTCGNDSWVALRRWE